MANHQDAILVLSTELNCGIFQKAAERGGYGTERYEKLEFRKKVAEHYYALRDSSWKVIHIKLVNLLVLYDQIYKYFRLPTIIMPFVILMYDQIYKYFRLPSIIMPFVILM